MTQAIKLIPKWSSSNLVIVLLYIYIYIYIYHSCSCVVPLIQHQTCRVLNEYKRGGHEGDFEDTEDASLLTNNRYVCGGIRIQHIHPTYGFNGGTFDHTNGTGHLPADDAT